jgi:hypothetical protein
MSQRSDTCNVKCPFFKKYKEYCPNFVKGQWRTVEGHVYETRDCAPKRSMILCQQIYDHMIDVRQDYNQVRNSTFNLMRLVGQQNNIDVLIGHEEVQEAKLIEE